MSIAEEYYQIANNEINTVHLSEAICNDIYIQSLLVAISRINRNSIVSNGKLMTEPSFCSELKSIWDSVLQQYNPHNLKVLNDQTKWINNNTIRPDIVLHDSTETCEGNHMAIEVKRNNQRIDAIKEDFRRLCIYLSNENTLNENFSWKSFDYGVFLILGKRQPLGKIIRNKNVIKDAINEHREIFRNVICIGYDGSKIECETLNNVLR